MRRPDPRDEPMSARADESAAVDAWHGARIAARARRAALDAQRRTFSEIDLGEPAVPRVVLVTLLASLFATLVEFQRFGTSPTAQQLDTAGGSSAVALARGDWSSIVMANLLHSGVQHFVLNAFIILLVGRWVEHVGGRWLTAAVVGVGAIGTTIGSLVSTPLTVTIGASGIAFALLGCGLLLDPRAKTGLGVIVRPMLILNVLGTFLVPGISIGGHLGGLAAGVVVGALAWRPKVDPSIPTIGTSRRAVSVALASVAFVALAWTFVWHEVAPRSARDVGTDVATQLIDSKSAADAG